MKEWQSLHSAMSMRCRVRKATPNGDRRAQATLRTTICPRDQHRPHLCRPWREGPGICLARKGLRGTGVCIVLVERGTQMGQPALRATLRRPLAPCRTPVIAQTVAKVDERKAEWREARYLGG